MSTLEVRALSVEVGGKIVVDGLSLALRPGDKVGVVGRNGAGKTSTLRVLAGEEQAAAGTVVRRGAVGYLRQDPRQHRAENESSGLEHMLSARGLVELSRRLEKARLTLEESHLDRNVSRFARLEEEYRDLGGYQAEAEARSISAGLGLAADRLELPVRALSGGEKRRLELARILFGGSDLLLLDEPTNHLDADAKLWLMKFLASFKGALMVVSHDLGLLDGSITRILHLDRDGIVEYRGTYSQYREARARDEVRLTAIAGRQEQEIRRLKTLADSMRGQTAKRARKAKTLDTRVTKLEAKRVTGPAKERKVTFRFPEPPHCGRQVLIAQNLAKSYGGPAVFEHVSFDVGRGERLLIMGLNGAGKTSLLRILAGESEADAGRFRLGHGAQLGYYAQEHEGIREGVTVLDHMHVASLAEDQMLRSLLGMFRLTGQIAFQDAGTLSGGEKTKLALAQLVAGRKNVLLLDEPTNNLDPPSRRAIADALQIWPGAMVIVSHDTEFVEALAPQRVLMMPDGTLDFWSEDLLELVALA
ncbi:MAG TPA: ABC-F family ATP-binding cassette domain-containing protein [Actinomycetota bacterium]|jgi:ATPase subunit of ABC transporter with duplicated ATPase domains|nr:ABC-F family ATP-binding cassette domain-containing protein [Actinomycetota bacterium]